MDFKTFGNTGSPTLLLIPGLGVSYEILLWCFCLLDHLLIGNEEDVLKTGLDGYMV